MILMEKNSHILKRFFVETKWDKLLPKPFIVRVENHTSNSWLQIGDLQEILVPSYKELCFFLKPIFPRITGPMMGDIKSPKWDHSG